MTHRLRWIAPFLSLSFAACASSGTTFKFEWPNTPTIARGTTPGYSDLFLHDELDQSLWCTDGMTVRYQAEPYRRTRSSELDLFAVDPPTISAKLASLSRDAINAGAWQQLTAGPEALPRAMAIPVALAAEPPTVEPAEVTTAVDPTVFWGTGSFLPSFVFHRSCQVAGSGTWSNTSRVEAAAVYHHGACSTTQDLGSLLQQVSDGVWNNFHASGSMSNTFPFYRFATAILEEGSFTDGKNGDEAPNVNMRGGFLFSFYFRGDILSSNNEVWGTYQYLFSLRDGFLWITDDDVTEIHHDSKGPWGWLVEGKMQSAMKNDVPVAITSTALGRQRVTLPAPATCNVLAECEVASIFLASQITAQSLMNAGVTNPTPEQITELRCAVGGRVECEQLGRLPDLNRIWSCPFFPFPGLACQFNVRAKRLIAYPNELELVWFDDFEFNNPTFGLFVAGFPGTARSLCSATPPVATPPAAFFTRAFATVGKMGM